MSDLIVQAKYILTMDEKLPLVRDGAVVIGEDKIVAIGPRDLIRRDYRGAEVIDGPRSLLMPGLINCHIHTREQLSLGLFPDDLDTEEWFNKCAWPYHQALTPEEEYTSFLLALVSMVRVGTTTFAEGGMMNPESALSALKKIGLRAVLCRWTWDKPEFFRTNPDEAVRIAERLYYSCHNQLDGRVRVGANPISALSCSKELLLQLKRWADEKHLRVFLHLASSREEVEKCRRELGSSPVSYLSSLGLMEENVVFLHVIHIEDSDVSVLANGNCKIVLCPASALKKGKGLTRAGKFPELLEAGLTVGLGSDGASSGNYCDLFRLSYLAATIFKDARMNATLVGAWRALRMATVDAAKVLGMEEEVGSISVGKKADIILLDLDNHHFTPLNSLVDGLVYSSTGDNVDTVIVDGQVLVKNKQLVCANESEISAAAEAAAETIRRKTGLAPRF